MLQCVYTMYTVLHCAFQFQLSDALHVATYTVRETIMIE